MGGERSNNGRVVLSKINSKTYVGQSFYFSEAEVPLAVKQMISVD